MSIGVIVLLAACAYSVVFAIIIGLREKPQTDMGKKQEGGNKSFIIIVFGAVLFLIAYMMIIPVPKSGTDRWFNSVLILRYFWKTLGSLFAAGASFGVSMLLGLGIGSLLNKKKKIYRRKRQSGWKSLNKEEALSAFDELYRFEIGKVNIATANTANTHEGYYGRFNNKMEQVARYATLADIRIAAIQKLRNKHQLESCLNYEKDENVRKEIKLAISKK